MVMGNLLTAPLSALKQIGEQANATVQSLSSGMTKAASSTLDALAVGFPPLPGLPGAAPLPGAAALGPLFPPLPGLPGAQGPLFPTAQQLLPANLTQALGQVENLLIPPGLPRPTQIFAGVAQPPVTTQPPAEKPAATTPANTTASRRPVAERRGM